MIRSLIDLTGYVIAAKDGELGECKDFLLDDLSWAVRYMVADTRKVLPGRKVVVSPDLLGDMDDETRRFSVLLSKEEVKASPPLLEDEPVTPQYEVMWHDHFGLSYYWLKEEERGMTENPSVTAFDGREPPTGGVAPSEPKHLLSLQEVTNFHVELLDGEIGRFADLLADTHTWQCRYAIVDTGKWLPGRQVCVLTDCITWVNPADEKLGVGLTKEAIRMSPEYHPYVPMNREYQVVLHDYYGWPKYWEK
jgi:hypothetical protein